MVFNKGRAWNQKFPYAPNEDAGDNHRGLLPASLYRALKGWTKWTNGIASYSNPDQGNIFSSSQTNNLAQNAYYDGTNWRPYVVGQPASAFAPGAGSIVWYTQDVATDPIVWTASTLVRNPDSGWIAPALSANWSSFGGGWSTIAYRKYPDGKVAVKGLAAKSIAIVPGETIFTLPVGFRPPEHEYRSTESGGVHASIFAFSTGPMGVQVGNAAYISLAMTFDTT